MLCARNVSVRRGAMTVLENIDLELAPGQVLGVLGPNGAGKSTLLGALSGELAISAGEVQLHQRSLHDWDGPERARCLAVLPQTSTLSFGFRVDEVVSLGRLPHASGQDLDRRIVAAALQAADAQHLAARSYLALSGGEQQRVHLARVLAQLWPGGAGQVLLLDEPTAMLDPLHQHGILQAVRQFAEQGGAVMVILHDLNLAARYCDHLLLLADGRARLSGAPGQVLRAEPLKSVFGLDVLIQQHPERGHPLVIAR
ncbi:MULTISPECIES: heme ABC transporter ATP-binding protein [Pseudomonadaceae]|uniref:heme ABC transporter ATP-binding protein n=1 Tax=Pseudomonadaceae TaxID=135621 RepID=UPI0015E46E0A|nr:MULTISPECIES: heme ABC transporter ATP-binding protein [Pseudomonadaceae]MBA1276980.1 heme ABC transporter ATP-binding protein [Stutzerimonas stutzeri]MBC8651216.1 heme ABC transporter ATP-binding protein [Pseudomonas sp. MT4]QXY93432.1 heme ABC transporter ATP-binding protein [Pseudomonas sp. MTM4]